MAEGRAFSLSNDIASALANMVVRVRKVPLRRFQLLRHWKAWTIGMMEAVRRVLLHNVADGPVWKARAPRHAGSQAWTRTAPEARSVHGLRPKINASSSPRRDYVGIGERFLFGEHAGGPHGRSQ